MERFYGLDHSIGLTNEDAEHCIRLWCDEARREASSEAQDALVSFLDERLDRRVPGSRAFRIAPAPEPIADRATVDFFAEIVASSALEFFAPGATLRGRPLPEADRHAWLARSLDFLAFVNQARELPLDTDSPLVAPNDVAEVKLRRMWSRFSEALRMENHVFIDDPRYPDPARLLEYVDQMLSLAEADGREQRREWPFPKILWEREALLEKLGRLDEMAATMRRSAALEDESFRRQTEEYIAVVTAA